MTNGKSKQVSGYVSTSQNCMSMYRGGNSSSVSTFVNEVILKPLQTAGATGESDVVQLDFSVSVGSLEQANTSFIAHHILDPSVAADFRRGAKLDSNDTALVLSFHVADAVDPFKLGELSGFVKNLLALGFPNSGFKASAKMDTEATGERVYRLVLSCPNIHELASVFKLLQLGQGYLGELSFSHKLGDEVDDMNNLKAALIIKASISRAYMQGLGMVMSLPFAPLGLVLGNARFGLGFENVAGILKAFPDIPSLDVSTLNGFSKELNILLAGFAQAEGVPAPAKETFFAFQECLKDLHEASLYVGDDVLSVKCTGLEFEKFLLPREELMKISPDKTQLKLFVNFPVVSMLNRPEEYRALLLGLDAGGKTLILYKLKLGEVVTTIPTIGFNVESIEYKNARYTVWDVGGQQQIRVLWKHYLQSTQALIFVVDSNDRERIEEAKDELQKVLAEEEVKDASLLVLANKQDLPNAMSVSEISDKLGLHSLRNRKWYIQATCGVTGDGLYEGLDWLTACLSK